jgi:La-related protein 7
MKMTESVTAEIIKQVEYYMGDLNLSKDDFFRDIISSSQDGYIDIAYILKCNKVKKLGVNKS